MQVTIVGLAAEKATVSAGAAAELCAVIAEKLAARHNIDFNVVSNLAVGSE